MLVGTCVLNVCDCPGFETTPLINNCKNVKILTTAPTPAFDI